MLFLFSSSTELLLFESSRKKTQTFDPFFFCILSLPPSAEEQLVNVKEGMEAEVSVGVTRNEYQLLIEMSNKRDRIQYLTRRINEQGTLIPSSFYFFSLYLQNLGHPLG